MSDKGVCAFSGLSLWMLDYGTAPFSHFDWPDHIVPVSRGGKDAIVNLVCASYWHNSKKVNNGRDNYYLFRDGRPTDDFFWTHGELTSQQAALLERNARLTVADWYFNRALANLTVALNNEAIGAEVVRTPDYWIGSAQKKLSVWRKLSAGRSSFARRGLVRYPAAPDVQLMLSLATVGNSEVEGVYRKLGVHYRANTKTMERFCRARSATERRAVLSKASSSMAVTESLMSVLRYNLASLRLLDLS